METIKNFIAERTTGEMALIGVCTAIAVFVIGVQFGGGVAIIEDLAVG